MRPEGRNGRLARLNLKFKIMQLKSQTLDAVGTEFTNFCNYFADRLEIDYKENNPPMPFPVYCFAQFALVMEQIEEDNKIFN